MELRGCKERAKCDLEAGLARVKGRRSLHTWSGSMHSDGSDIAARADDYSEVCNG